MKRIHLLDGEEVIVNGGVYVVHHHGDYITLVYVREPIEGEG